MEAGRREQTKSAVIVALRLASGGYQVRNTRLLTAPRGIEGNEIGSLDCASKSAALSSSPDGSFSNCDGDVSAPPIVANGYPTYETPGEVQILSTVGTREAFDFESR